MRAGTEEATLDVAAFAHAHGQNLLDFAYLVARDRSLAEDLVQTVLARLAPMSSEQLSAVDRPVAYARRAILNEFRSQYRRHLRWDALVPKVARAEHIASVETATADRLAIFDALGALNPRQRAAVVLRYYEDLSDHEIANVLGCAPATVRTIVARALRQMRPLMEDNDD
jgi:RNA polymerase sigma factor (sigma-70 family)